MSGSQLTPNSPAQQPRAASANPTDILLADQLNTDGVTYTTRGLPAELVAAMLAQFMLIGARMIVGQGAPSNSVGNNGDLYFDSQAVEIYGPKATNSWPVPGTSLIGGLVASVVGLQGVITAAQISAALDTVASGLVATGTTPAAATPCTAKSNIFTTVGAGGYAILTNTQPGYATEVVNRGANPMLLLPQPNWQFENYGVNEPIEVAQGTPAYGSMKFLNDLGGVCRVIS